MTSGYGTQPAIFHDTDTRRAYMDWGPAPTNPHDKRHVMWAMRPYCDECGSRVRYARCFVGRYGVEYVCRGCDIADLNR